MCSGSTVEYGIGRNGRASPCDTSYLQCKKHGPGAEASWNQGFDENWTDTTIEKEFSLDIDVSNMNDFLEINLRGYSTAADKVNYELLPTQDYSSTQDQQSYYIKIADIDLQTLKKNK